LTKCNTEEKISSTIGKELGSIFNYLSELIGLTNVKNQEIFSCFPSKWKLIFEKYYKNVFRAKNHERNGFNFNSKVEEIDSSNFVGFMEIAEIGTKGKSELIQEHIKLQK